MFLIIFECDILQMSGSLPQAHVSHYGSRVILLFLGLRVLYSSGGDIYSRSLVSNSELDWEQQLSCCVLKRIFIVSNIYHFLWAKK